METIISSAISAAVTLIVCLVTNIASQKRTLSIIEYKLEELTKKVEKHNTVIERTYALEKRADVYEEKIKVCNNRLADLERKEEQR